MKTKREPQRIEDSESIANLRRRILRTGSSGTAQTYTDRLRIFFGWLGKGPDEFLADVEAGKTDVVKTLNRYLDDLHAEGKSPSTQAGRISAIKKLVEINIDMIVNWKRVELPKRRGVEEDKVPTKEIIREVLVFSNLKERAIILTAASSGLRLGSMTALSMEDLDLESEPDVGIIRIPASKSKGQVKFTTFITPEARQALEAYLKTRRETGPKSAVFERRTGGHYMRSDKLAKRWLVPLAKAGLDTRTGKWRDYRFHTLRKFMRTALEYGGISKSFRERLLGHLGEYLDGSYFGPALQNLVAEYRKAIPHLTIKEVAVVTREGAALEAMRAIAITHGIDPSRLVIGEVSAAAEIDLLRGAIESSQSLGVVKVMRTGEPIRTGTLRTAEAIETTQKIIEENVLEEYMADGWKFISTLNNGSSRVIVEKAQLTDAGG